jgi:hypothetical protein
MENCPICGKHLYNFFSNQQHKCDPSFFVFSDVSDVQYYIENNDEPKKWFSDSEESAAVKHCEDDFECPDEIELWVISTKKWDEIIERNDAEYPETTTQEIQKAAKHFRLESEITRNFYAREVSD